MIVRVRFNARSGLDYALWSSEYREHHNPSGDIVTYPALTQEAAIIVGGQKFRQTAYAE
jgi:hypothetical protein